MQSKIVMVGAGSVGWSPKLIRDLILTPEIAGAHYELLDIDEEAGTKMAELGRGLAREWGLDCTFAATTDQREAFREADFVIITISTGGLDAMEHDLKIPEDYQIYQTVGDTVGPGGWARSLRNIPVFVQMARDIEDLAPQALVLNYTNPMATLTKVFSQVSSLRTVGLCHGLFEVYAVLQSIFGLESEDDIAARFGGTNHFFWIFDLSIRGQDGYALLRDKMAGRPFAQLVTEAHVDGAGFQSDKWVCSELFDTYGYLPYVADRHIAEFLPRYLTVDEGRIDTYHLKRTSIEERREGKRKGAATLDAMLRGQEQLPKTRSRETAADIIAAVAAGNRDFIDVMNLPNEGQIPNLPLGSIVETLGVANGRGFTPVHMGEMPRQLLPLVLPHVLNQDTIVDAALEGDMAKALWALYHDPLCSHLTLPEIKQMGLRLLEANKEFLP